MLFVNLSLELGQHLLLLRGAVVKAGSNINPVCALSLAVEYVCQYHFPYTLCRIPQHWLTGTGKS